MVFSIAGAVRPGRLAGPTAGTAWRRLETLGNTVDCQGVALDSLSSRERQIALFERYGSLLTEHQRLVLELYFRRDWSLSEVAAHQQTSRAAVHDLVRRSSQAMEAYERRLGLLDEAGRRREQAAVLSRELARLRRRLARAESGLEKIR